MWKLLKQEGRQRRARRWTQATQDRQSSTQRQPPPTHSPEHAQPDEGQQDQGRWDSGGLSYREYRREMRRKAGLEWDSYTLWGRSPSNSPEPESCDSQSHITPQVKKIEHIEMYTEIQEQQISNMQEQESSDEFGPALPLFTA